MGKSWLLLGLAVLLAVESGAQTTTAPPEDERRPPAYEIRVLRHAYDISSFYTSAPPSAPAFRGGAFAAPRARDCSEERYPISCYYRSSQLRPWRGYPLPFTPEPAEAEWRAFDSEAPRGWDRLGNRVRSPPLEGRAPVTPPGRAPAEPSARPRVRTAPTG